MAEVNKFNEYVEIFNRGMDAFNESRVEEAKKWLTEASRRASILSEEETDPELKEKLSDRSRELLELIDMHLKDVEVKDDEVQEPSQIKDNNESVEPNVEIKDPARDETPVSETIEKSWIIEQKEIFDNGIAAYKAGDNELAKENLTKAANLAEQIYTKTSNEDTRNEYAIVAQSTNNFVNNFIQNTIQTFINNTNQLVPTLVKQATPTVVETVDKQAKTIKIAISQKTEVNFL